MNVSVTLALSLKSSSSLSGMVIRTVSVDTCHQPLSLLLLPAARYQGWSLEQSLSTLVTSLLAFCCFPQLVIRGGH